MSSTLPTLSERLEKASRALSTIRALCLSDTDEWEAKAIEADAVLEAIGELAADAKDEVYWCSANCPEVALNLAVPTDDDLHEEALKGATARERR